MAYANEKYYVMDNVRGKVVLLKKDSITESAKKIRCNKFWLSDTHALDKYPERL